MSGLARFLVSALLFLVSKVDGEAFSVRIATENHVNEVDSRFVSFTIDPKYLFGSSDDLSSKESTCMAASLAPAYLRIAGPSTSHITFNNKSMTIEHLDTYLPEPNKQKRHLIKKETEEDYDYEDSNEDILTKLRRSSEKLLKRHRRQLISGSQEGTLDEDEEKLKPKLKKSKIHALAKHKKISKDYDKERETADESHESLLTKLKSRRLSKLKSNKEESEERPKRLRRLSKDNLEVSHRQWKRFAKWAKDTGFSLVFAVNNGEKTENGMWDPNPALNMLTIADKDDMQEIYWQLGYECNNQTLEDYLNDLQTLRMMVDTFDARHWKVVGGDISACLEAGSKSDFKDYVTLSADSMDAVLLNGNSSSHELARMSEASRLSLLRVLSTSNALWLTERPQQHSEQARAADWLTSLGYSARNGFHVHFRELLENELFEPTLSFYMALLFKNLVGERVLELTMEPSDGQAALFAHCTSLRHKPVPGAVTLYGVNMDSEPARFSVKLAKREEEGDIMQFILGHDHSGNIVVNGRPMFYEGNIRPVVKRVRPFKTLLLNLPPKSFGFWVLANTKVNACFDDESKDETLVEAKPVKVKESKEIDVEENKSEVAKTRKEASEENKRKEAHEENETKEAHEENKTKEVHEENKTKEISEENQTKEASEEIKTKEVSEEYESKQEIELDETKKKIRMKRSINLSDFDLDIDINEFDDINNNEALRNRIDGINRGLRDVQGLIDLKDSLITNRVKRQISGEEFDSRRKQRKQSLRKGDRKFKHEHKLVGSGIFEKIMNNIQGKIPKLNLTKSIKGLKQRKLGKNNMSKHTKRNSRNYRNREDLSEADEEDSHSRKKRSLLVSNKNHGKDKTEKNEIDLDGEIHGKYGKILKKHKEMQNAIDNDDDKSSDYDHDNHKSHKDGGIEINTKITEDDAEIKISENTDHGLLETALENVLSLLDELNHNLSKVWSSLSFLD
ncbi:uncharacterized protein LOC125238402 [Leguminivora glycinivorella]|uniref:uncharacterized protein LOC125238402 n=1 Tax=Leguminivora glycinivorella TaxID=1035111 RepID=UPI00200BA7DA|nr:uncharacterized protein LOC125238402 [Leguminivora glycinivorella]